MYICVVRQGVLFPPACKVQVSLQNKYCGSTMAQLYSVLVYYYMPQY